MMFTECILALYICKLLLNFNIDEMYITVILSDIQTDKSKLADNMVAFRLPPRQAEFDKMAIEFHRQGAIQKPNRHQLGKLTMLYLGGV